MESRTPHAPAAARRPRSCYVTIAGSGLGSVAPKANNPSLILLARTLAETVDVCAYPGGYVGKPPEKQGLLIDRANFRDREGGCGAYHGAWAAAAGPVRTGWSRPCGTDVLEERRRRCHGSCTQLDLRGSRLAPSHTSRLHLRRVSPGAQGTVARRLQMPRPNANETAVAPCPQAHALSLAVSPYQSTARVATALVPVVLGRCAECSLARSTDPRHGSTAP